MWELLNLTPNEGRLAVVDPRATEKLEIIRHLLFLQNTTLDEDKFSTLWSGISEVKNLRDLLAHGIWVKDDEGWKALNFKGNVTDQTIHKLARKRKIRPESFLATTASLASLIDAIDELIASVDSLGAALQLPRKPHMTTGEIDGR